MTELVEKYISETVKNNMALTNTSKETHKEMSLTVSNKMADTTKDVVVTNTDKLVEATENLAIATTSKGACITEDVREATTDKVTKAIHELTETKMSENNKEGEWFIEFIPVNTTTITDHIRVFPCTNRFLTELTKNVVIQSKSVGASFRYPANIHKNRYYSNYGQFIDYFIRKQLSNIFHFPITDSRTLVVLEDKENTYKLPPKLREAIQTNYKIFTDNTKEALDIIRSIKIVSLAHSLFFLESIPRTEFDVDYYNLVEVKKYLESLKLSYTSVLLNPSLSTDYMNADADFIFDNELVIYEIKNSKFRSLKKEYELMRVQNFFQNILYGYGFFKNHHKKVLKFAIYNPLLGFEDTIELEDIDYDKLEEAVKEDVIAFNKRGFSFNLKTFDFDTSK